MAIDLVNKFQEKEINELRKTIDKGFDGVHSRLDKLNGQVSENKTEIRILKTVWPVVSVLVGIVGFLIRPFFQ